MGSSVDTVAGGNDAESRAGIILGRYCVRELEKASYRRPSCCARKCCLRARSDRQLLNNAGVRAGRSTDARAPVISPNALCIMLYS